MVEVGGKVQTGEEGGWVASSEGWRWRRAGEAVVEVGGKVQPGDTRRGGPHQRAGGHR